MYSEPYKSSETMQAPTEQPFTMAKARGKSSSNKTTLGNNGYQPSRYQKKQGSGYQGKNNNQGTNYQIKVATQQSENTQSLYKTDLMRLKECRESGKPFKVIINSDAKYVMRNVCGTKTDHVNNITVVASQQKPNDFIMNKIHAQNRKRSDSKLSFLVFCCHTAVKIDNVNLLKDIVKILSEFMTEAEIFDARYGDSEYNLINIAAWNNSIGGLRYCVGKGVDINIINNDGESIFQMLENGVAHQNKGLSKNSTTARVNNDNYKKCVKFLQDSIKHTGVSERVEDTKAFTMPTTPVKESVATVETTATATTVLTPEAKKNTKVPIAPKKRPPLKPQSAPNKVTSVFAALDIDSDTESEEEEEEKEEIKISHNDDTAGREHANQKISEIYNMVTSKSMSELGEIVTEMQVDMSTELIKFMNDSMASEGLTF